MCRQIEDRQKEVDEALQQMGFNEVGGEGNLSFRCLFSTVYSGKPCIPPPHSLHSHSRLFLQKILDWRVTHPPHYELIFPFIF